MLRSVLLFCLVALALLPQSAMAQQRPRRAQAATPGGARRAASPHVRAPRESAKLVRERPGSVGHPNEGRLEGGVHLDTSLPYVRVVPAYARGDVRWGLPALIGMIDRAARAVARKYPGAVLGVGDISRKGGGEVSRHHSHESGRDADIAFYVLGPDKKGVLAPTFVKFDETLVASSPAGARFDLPRNWLLVQHMVTDPVAQVSHIFIAEPLRQRLLAYARSIGVSQRILDRAAIAMMQPTNALPHDDHFHVRISCPRSMRGTCIELAKEGVRPRARTARAHRQPPKLLTPMAATGRPAGTSTRP